VSSSFLKCPTLLQNAARYGKILLINGLYEEDHFKIEAAKVKSGKAMGNSSGKSLVLQKQNRG
jgi:hypothetical protein